MNGTTVAIVVLMGWALFLIVVVVLVGRWFLHADRDCDDREEPPPK
jgi:hypothetical protein